MRWSFSILDELARLRLLIVIDWFNITTCKELIILSKDEIIFSILALDNGDMLKKIYICYYIPR